MEIILIFLAVLLLFGAKRIPEIARGMGKGIREFRSATREISSELSMDNTSDNTIHSKTPMQGTPAPRQDNPPRESEPSTGS